MFCPTCGKKQPENAYYCYSCGRKIEIPIQDDDSLSENIESTSTDKINIEDVMIEAQEEQEEPPVLQMTEEENREERRIGEEVKCPHCGLWQRRDRVICFKCAKPLNISHSLTHNPEVLGEQTNNGKPSEDRTSASVYINNIGNNERDIETHSNESLNIEKSNSRDEKIQNSKNTKIGCGFILFIFILIVVLYTITTSGGQFTSSKATCKMCGRSWNSGDSGGNYMSIALSGMCKSCKSNYKWSQAALGN